MDSNKLLKYIELGLEKEIKEQFDEKMKELNEKKNEICAGILLNVMKYVEMNKFGENITFTIKEIK